MKAKSHSSDFLQILARISHRHGIRRVFDAFIRFAACALAARRLKIEQDGDFWKATIRSKIRLKGRWLENAGFKPGGLFHRSK